METTLKELLKLPLSEVLNLTLFDNNNIPIIIDEIEYSINEFINFYSKVLININENEYFELLEAINIVQLVRSEIELKPSSKYFFLLNHTKYLTIDNILVFHPLSKIIIYLKANTLSKEDYQLIRTNYINSKITSIIRVYFERMNIALNLGINFDYFINEGILETVKEIDLKIKNSSYVILYRGKEFRLE